MSSTKSPNRPSANRPSGTTSSGSKSAEKPADKVPEAVRPPAAPRQGSTAPKQVRLKLVHIDFWSAVKLSFLISAALGIVLFVAVLLIWTVLDSTGVFSQISKLTGDVTGQAHFSVSSVVSFAQVMGFTLVIAALDVVVGTVLGAIACILYNLSVRISGGILVGFTNQ